MINFQEFMFLEVMFSKQDHVQAMELTFDFIDSDDDDVINKGEMEMLVQLIYDSLSFREKFGAKSVEEIINDVFNEIDDDNSDDITKEEFMGAMTNKGEQCRATKLLVKKLLTLFG